MAKVSEAVKTRKTWEEIEDENTQRLLDIPSNSSWFVEGRALFGGFPNQDRVKHLERIGVKVFVDLTSPAEEGIVPYTLTSSNRISFVMQDHSIPSEWKAYAMFIVGLCKLIESLKQGELIYLHCRGGHGRSGVVVASVFCYGLTLLNIGSTAGEVGGVHTLKLSPAESLELTNRCHNNRLEMRLKWREIGSPQTKRQKSFIHHFFKPLRFGPHHNPELFHTVLSTRTKHEIALDYGTFATCFDAYRFHRGILSDFDRVTEVEKVSILKTIVKSKFEQHPAVTEVFLDTGLRPLVKSSNSRFWGREIEGGINAYGSILNEVREEILLARFKLKYPLAPIKPPDMRHSLAWLLLAGTTW